MDYQDSVTAVLESIRSRDGPLASGAATALALSLGVECLALAAALSRRAEESTNVVDPLDELDASLDRWRRYTAEAFADDPIRFGRVLAARTARDAGPDQDRHMHTERELEALSSATVGLVELLRVSIEVEGGAARLAGHCVTHALGEAATARALAQASNEALLVMISSNIDVMRRRTADGSPPRELETVAQAAGNLPEGPLRVSLESYLRAGPGTHPAFDPVRPQRNRNAAS